MKDIFKFTVCALILTAPALHAASKPKAANCELRLVNQASAGAGEIFMAIFTKNQEECLTKSDSTVEAQFKANSGLVVAKRGGAGPQP
jgi:hypothetical protein